jgi:ribonuclease HI
LLEEHAQAGDNVRVVSDSELLVKQINGDYRVKQEQLKPLHALARATVEKLGCVVTHVLRDENVLADKLANQGIDKKILLPSAFIRLLERHAITL